MVCLICISATSWSQICVRGYVGDIEGKPVAGANIAIKEGQQTLALQTDSVGFFIQRIARHGSIRMIITDLGYQSIDTVLTLMHDVTLSFCLLPNTHTLDYVTITACQKINPNKITITSQALQVQGRSLGETDIVSILQQQAGVIHTSEVSPGIYVRGMDCGNTGIYYGGSELFGINHMLSIYPQFNSDAIGQAQLIKSDFSPAYGGSLASYFIVQPVRKVQSQFHGSAETGVLTTKLSAGIPISKKLYCQTSLRRSYFDLIANYYNKARSESEDRLPLYGFYDITNSLIWNTEASGTFAIDALYSHDNISFNDQQLSYNADWHNTLLSCQWNKQLHNNINININGGYSQFGLMADFSNLLGRMLTNSVHQGNANITVTRHFSSDLTVETGIEVKLNHIKMQSSITNVGANENLVDLGIASENMAFFGQLQWPLNRFLIMKSGLRVEMFYSDKSFYHLLPYLSFKEQYRSWTSEVSYSRQVQNKHLFMPTGINLPLNIWYPATSTLSPEQAHHFNFTISHSFNTHIHLSLSAFYIRLQDPTEFLESNYFTNLKFTTEKGQGYSQGIEMMFNIRNRKFELSGGYTWSASRRRFASINEGKWFKPSYDIPHKGDLNIVFYPHKRWTLTASQFVQSGIVTTLPTSIYLHQQADATSGANNQIVPIYTSRYNFRMPLMHRLDVSAAYSLTAMKCKSTLTIGAYNVYNYGNPYFIYFEPQQQADMRNYLQAQKKSLLPFVPFINYKIAF